MTAPASPSPRQLGWIRRLGAECWRHRTITLGALAVTIVAALIDISFPLLTKVALDAAQSGDPGQIIGAVAAAIAGLAVVRFACQYGRRMLAGRLSLDVQHDLRLGLLASLQRLDGRGQDQIRTGQIVSRSITDLQLVQGLLAMAPLSAGALLQFVLALIIMAWLSPLLTLVALTVVPAVIATVWLVRPSLFAATWSAQQRAADLAEHVEETVTGVRVVKGFGQEHRAVDILERHSRSLYAERMRTAKINARFTPTMTALPQLGLVGVIAVGGVLAMNGAITIGTFLAFATYVATMATVTRTLAQVVIMANMSRAAVERVYDVLTSEPEIADPPAPQVLPTGPLGIAFRDVHFGFDSQRPVLKGLDLHIAPGESVAVVGSAGSGKTALSLLLPRFYAADAGTVSLTVRDEAAAERRYDVLALSAEQIRSAVGLVFDEPFLFSDSIAANIALGLPDASADQIRAAARLAAADEFIEALPQGYDTVVGERGLTLSGGQRQRIALARALLVDPPVLVLDDATSAVDAATESTIYRALRSDGKRTTLILAHRLSTLELADRVAVLEAGRIVDIGTVPELRVRSAAFRALFASGEPTDTGPSDGAAPPRPTHLWPQDVNERIATGGSRVSAPPATVGGARSGGGVSGAIGALTATPQILEAVEQLPPATESPAADTATLRRDDPTFRLMSILTPVRWLLVAVVALLTLDSLANIALPSIVRVALDRGVVPGDAAVLWLATAIGFAVVVSQWFVIAAMTVLTARAGERVLFGLRVRSYAHLQRLGLDYYERELSGRIMTRMTTDVDALSSFIQTGMSTAIVSVLTITGISVALLLTDPTLALVTLAALPPLAVATLIFRKISGSAYTLSRERISVVNADFQENIAGLRATQAYRREEYAAQRFADRATSYRHSRMRSQQAISVYFPFIAFLSDLALAAVVFVGARQVASGATSAGVLVAFVLYLGLVFGPVQQLSQVFDGYQQARVGLRRIADLLATRSSIETVAASDTVPIEGHLRGDVVLDDVTFRYQSAAADALRGVSLHIDAGTTVALVGRTGAGKSTIIKLLARFYDPTRGSVQVDDVDLRHYQLGEYRHRLGVVPQEAHLFTGTVASNIAFGRPSATRTEIEDAARAVGALETIAALDGAMNQPIGERGQGLSAGQRQLIALARAELVNPDLLLLDEATATLDPATERKVLDAGRAVTSRRTSVIVAHRLATAANSDVVVVVSGGRIVEIGSHERLVTAGGHYADLWDAAQEKEGNNL